LRIVRLQRGAGPFTLLVIVFAASSVGLSSGARPDLFDEIYRRGQARNGNLKTLTASFTESTTSSLLTRPLTARGVVAVERPDRVALRYSEPDERTVIIDGERLTLAWPARGVHQTRDIGASQRRVRKYFVESSPDELREHFDLAAREAADRPGYLITLTPKRKQIQEGLSQLELWVDSASLLLSAMRMTFPNGENKTMTFSDVKVNPQLDPSAFAIPRPGQGQ
jgi:outer membrane lipoprotein-sorting protein